MGSYILHLTQRKGEIGEMAKRNKTSAVLAEQSTCGFLHLLANVNLLQPGSFVNVFIRRATFQRVDRLLTHDRVTFVEATHTRVLYQPFVHHWKYYCCVLSNS